MSKRFAHHQLQLSADAALADHMTSLTYWWHARHGQYSTVLTSVGITNRAHSQNFADFMGAARVDVGTENSTPTHTFHAGPRVLHEARARPPALFNQKRFGRPRHVENDRGIPA